MPPAREKATAKEKKAQQENPDADGDTAGQRLRRRAMALGVSWLEPSWNAGSEVDLKCPCTAVSPDAGFRPTTAECNCTADTQQR
jgi:hypothetical protein